jgi:hypothetical protein
MANSTFTMTQLAAAKRDYQRTTTTGGGQGKGQGTIPVTINVTVAGTMHARIRAADGSTILQAAFSLGTVATGSQTLNVTGVDARLGWFFVDLSGDSGATWTNGTTLVGMGRLIGFAGQSLAARMVKTMDASQSTITNASLGVTIDPNSVVYATYVENNNLAVPVWQTPADGSVYDSTGCAEYLTREVAAAGVNCALVSHTHGATSINSWIGAGADVASLQAILTAVGGFEAFIWFQGHSDGASGMSSATYQADLSTLFTWLAANNGVRGASFEKYVCSIPNIGNTNWGLPAQVSTIRQAARDWCAANGAVSVEPSNVDLLPDTTHQTQAGSIILARHFYRASRPSLGLPNGDLPAAVTGVTRSAGSAVINIALSGAGTPTSIGTPANRFSVSTKGGHAKMPISSIVASLNAIAITLASVPADNDPLDVHWDYPLAPSAAGNADMLYDAVTDSDGITPGRPFRPTYLAPYQIPAPTPSLGPTLTAHGTPTFHASGKSGFSNCLDCTAATGTAAYAASLAPCGDDVIPFSDVVSIECWFQISAIPAGTVCLYGVGGGGVYLAVNSAGHLNANWNSGGAITGTTNVCDGAWHYVQFVLNSWNNANLYLDGAADGTQLTYSGGGAAYYTPAPSTTTQVGNAFSAFQWPGKLMMLSTWTIARAAQVLAAPLTGSETGLYAAYKLDGNLNAMALAGSLAPASSAVATTSASVTLGYSGGVTPPPGSTLTAAINSRTSTTIAVVLGARTPASYDLIQFQYSTRPDFSFGMAPLADFATAAAITLQSLNQGNTYFVRAREKASASGALGPWCATMQVYLPLATSQDLTSQAVLLRPAIVVVPEPVTWGFASTPGGIISGYPIDNLASDSPAEQTWFTPGMIYFDTAGQPIDTIALLGTNIPAGVLWRAEGYPSAADRTAGTNIVTTSGDLQFQCSANLPGRAFYHGLIRLAAPSTATSWRLTFAAATGSFPPASVIAAMFGVVGLARTARNISADKVESPLEYGALDRTRDGIPDRRYGWRGRRVEFEIALMTEAQWETQFSDLSRKIGLIDPVLVLPNTRAGTYLHDRILYGPLTQQRGTLPYSPRFTQGFTIDSLI